MPVWSANLLLPQDGLATKNLALFLMRSFLCLLISLIFLQAATTFAATDSHDKAAYPKLADGSKQYAAFPKPRAARVAFVARDGRQGEHLQPTRVGDPDAPLSDAQLDNKYLEFAVPVLGEDRARKLLARLWKLEQSKEIAA